MLPKLDHPLFKLKILSPEKEYEFRTMTYAEEKLLLIAKQSGDDNNILLAIKQVVNNCCQDASFDVDRIAIFDLEYLFLKIRAHSVTNIVTITVKDYDDEKTYNIDIDLNKVIMNTENKQDPLIKVNEDIGILLLYPSASLYGNKEIGESKDSLFDIVIRCIDKIYNKDAVIDVKNESQEDLKKWVAQLDVKVYEKIRKFYENVPSMRYDIKYTNSLGKEKLITLSSLFDFFTF